MASFKSSALLAALLASAVSAQATTVALAADGQWQSFDVDSSISASGGTEWIDNYLYDSNLVGSSLSFTFTVAAGSVATLTVVDTGFAGDTFTVTNNGSLLGTTGAVPVQQYSDAATPVFDGDTALADASFSRAVFTLGAGSYSISGALLQSLQLDDGTGSLSPLNATSGALKLSISAVPEPSSLALLLAALGVTWIVSRRLPR